jgi:hypothetical protein
MNLDEELRDTLRVRAAFMTDGGELLESVRDRGHRADVRRRWFVVMAGLVAVATTVTVAAVRPFAAPAPRPPTSPGPTPSPTRTPLPAGVVPIVLGPARITLPAFPFTPGWVPSGLGRRWTGIVGSRAVLEYGYGGPRSLRLSVDTMAYQWDWEAASESTVQIGSYPAALRKGAAFIGLTWQLDDGRWLTVDGSEVSLADALRFARDLRPQPLPPPEMPFTLAWAPDGFVLQFVGSEGLCLAPATWPPADNSANGFCVAVSSNDYAPPPQSRPITLAGWSGYVLRELGYWLHVALQLPDGRLLSIEATGGRTGRESVYISDADLERFVEGVAVH